MCTLALSDMGELHDEWLRPARPRPFPEEVEPCPAMPTLAMELEMESRAPAAAA